MKIPPRRHPAAFTLIELMVVITIIVILAALVVGGTGYARDKQDREKAKVQIALLEKALEDFKADNGHYPYADGVGTTGNSNILFQALFREGADNKSRIYLSDLDPASTKHGWVEGTGGNVKIVDPWGREYGYRTAKINAQGDANPNAQNPDFDLWSVGKDGRHSHSADNFDRKLKENLDDIRNF
jgi:general secretion pathway protein G